MNPEDLAGWLDANPFAPFRLKLTNGETINVTKPQDMLTGLRTAVIAIPLESNPRYYHHWKTVSLDHMVAIEPISPVPQVPQED